MRTDTLVLPHRDIAARAFVLAPLADLRPMLPLTGGTVAALLARLDRTGIEPLEARSP